jgi:hypothetical protein
MTVSITQQRNLIMKFYAKQPLFLIKRKWDLDQTLAYCRTQYLAADDCDRARIRAYANDLADYAKKVWRLLSDHRLGHDLVMQTAFFDAPMTRNAMFQPIEIPVRILARAIEAWERGEDYTPEDSPDLAGE